MYSYNQYSSDNKNETATTAAAHQPKDKNNAVPLSDNRPAAVIQRKPNNTGLPDQLKSGIENLSGYSLDDVKVHYNSSKPAQLSAHAYAQGAEIHVASGQEKHLPHEAWHVVQQKQGRVQATMQMKSRISINDDRNLENEADRMGAKALAQHGSDIVQKSVRVPAQNKIVQCLPKLKNESEGIIYFEDHLLNIDENLTEVQDLLLLAKQKSWDDLQERITYYMRENEAKKSSKGTTARDGDSPQGKGGLLAELKILDKSDTASLVRLKAILEHAQDNGWDDIEELVLPAVRKLEDDKDSSQTGHGSKQSYTLKSRFYKLLESSGNTFSDEEKARAYTVAQLAHDTATSAHDFERNQANYQHLLLNGLGISHDVIMDFHRSSGLEYEFMNFYEQGKFHERNEHKEILRSHILLARSQNISGMFNLSFNLETDSNNALEMVIPPFLFLVSSETKSVLRDTYSMYLKAVTDLRTMLVKQGDALISDHLDKFEELGFSPGWKWVYHGTEKLSATAHMAKQASIYGQVNVSLSPEEIINMVSQLIDIEAERPQKQLLGQVYVPSTTTNLFNSIYETIWNASGKDRELKGVVGLYARSASNILGIPSILYRQITGERPAKGNYATDVKETLGIWIKDFSSRVIEEYLVTRPKERRKFNESVDGTAKTVWGKIYDAINKNLYDLETNHLQKVTDYYVTNRVESMKIEKAALVKRLSDQYGEGAMAQANKEFLAVMKTWDARTGQEMKMATERFNSLRSDFQRQAEQEYWQMVKLATASHKPGEIRAPARNEQEEFGSGLGVRKETYLNKLPGKRNLRVTEIRSGENLPELEQKLNQ